MTILMKRILKVTFWVLFIAFDIVALLSLNNSLMHGKYTVDTEEFDVLLTYGEEVDFNDIKIVDNRLFGYVETTLTDDMIISIDDTEIAGQKRIVFEHNRKRFSVTFYVRYKVEFVSEGEVIDTQMVASSEELEIPTPKAEQGYEFVCWDYDLTAALTDNVTVNAVFKKIEYPTLPTFTATYGDTLADFTLPSSADGHWEFIDPLDTPVGNAGENFFAVKFVYKNPKDYEKYGEVGIDVAKKKLEFNVDEADNVFVYDGESHSPIYSLGVEVDEVILTGGDKTEAGVYTYILDISDDNYFGDYTGTFEIVKPTVTVNVSSAEMEYSSEVPDFTFEVLGFENVDILGINITKPERTSVVGEYEVGATYTNNNVNYIINKGTLTVVPTAMESVPAPNYTTPTFEDKLSDIQFVGAYLGKWTWEDPDTVIDDINGITAYAIFTPDNVNYKPARVEIEISEVKKKVLTINVLKSEYVYTEGGEYKLVLEIVGGDYPELYKTLKIVGNDTETTAGVYERSVYIDDNRYDGYVSGQLKVAKATPVTDFTGVYDRTWSEGLTLASIQLPDGYSWSDPSAIINAGEYICDVIYTPDDTANYNTVSGEITVRVSKADATFSGINDAYEKIYDTKKLDVKNSGISVNYSDGELSIVYYKDGVEVDEIVNAGEYKVVISVTEGTNYFAATVERTVTVAPATNTQTVIDNQSAKYGDALSVLKLPADLEGSWSWRETEIGNAGKNKTFTAVYTPDENGNYHPREQEITVNVNKITLDVPGVSDKEYTGKEIETGLSDTDYYTVSGDLSATDADTYYVTFTLRDPVNFEWRGYEADESVVKSYKISKALNKWTTEPQNVTAEYDGDPVYVSAAAEHGTVTIVYTLNGAVVDAPIGVGVYKALVTVEDHNYDSLTKEVTVEITKQSVPVPDPTVSSFIYNGSEQGITVPESDLYSVYSEQKGTNAGAALKLVIKLTDPANYKWESTSNATVEFTATIAKATIDFSADMIVSKTEWTYTEDEASFTAATLDADSIALGATAELKFSTDNVSFNDSFADLPRTNNKINAGKYYVKTVSSDSSNWDTISTEVVIFEVKKATPDSITVTWKDTPTATEDGVTVYYQNLLKISTYVVKFGDVEVDVKLGEWGPDHDSFVFAGAGTVYSFNVTPLDDVNFEATTLTVEVPLKKVATVGFEGTAYGTINDAIGAASSGNIVWVIPDFSGNVKILDDLTIPSGVTLRLPYGSTKDDYNSSNVATESHVNDEFDAPAERNAEKYEKLRVILAVGKKITVESGATLDIAGKVYAGGGFSTQYTGQTAADYAVLIMDANSNIEISGTANVNGYIRELVKDNGSHILVKSGGRLDQPYVIRDFRTGNYLSVAKDSATNDPSKVYTPFARFILMNVSPMMKIEKGANTWGHANISSSIGITGTSGHVVGDDESAFLQITTGYMTFKYDVDREVMVIHLYGGANLNNFNLEAGSFTGGTISTKDYPVAFSYHMDITLDKLPNQSEAIYKLGNEKEQFKMMPGAKLTIESGATLRVTKLNVYNGDFVDDILCSTEESPDTGTYIIPYPSDKGDAILTVRGKLIAGTLGGNVHTDSSGGSVLVTSSTTATNAEINRFTADFFSSKVLRNTLVTNKLNLYYNGVLVRENVMLNVEYVSSAENSNWNFDISLLEIIEIELQDGYGVYTENALLVDEFGVVDVGVYDSRDSKQNVAILKVVKGNDVTFYLTKNQLFVMSAADSVTVDLTHSIITCESGYEYVIAPDASCAPTVYYVPSFRVDTTLEGKVTYYNLNDNDTATNITSYAVVEITVSNKVYLNGTLSLTVTGATPEFTYTGKAGVDSQDGTYTITGDKDSGTNVSITATLTISSNCAQTITVTSSYVKGEEAPCVTPDTLITLADGSQVRVDSLKGGELLLVWNLETGSFDVAPVMFVDSEGMSEYEIIYLYFSDGTVVKVIYEHGFWDYDLNRYVYLDADAADYIGHSFAKHNGDELVTVQLVDVEIRTERNTAWSPVTVRHLCYFVNGMLSMPGGVGGLFNIFDVDADTMAYDYEAMQRDIEEYGLYTYEELNAICPLSEDMFNAAGGAYLKISVAKGNLTIDELIAMIERYSEYF